MSTAPSTALLTVFNCFFFLLPSEQKQKTYVFAECSRTFPFYSDPSVLKSRSSSSQSKMSSKEVYVNVFGMIKCVVFTPGVDGMSDYQLVAANLLKMSVQDKLLASAISGRDFVLQWKNSKGRLCDLGVEDVISDDSDLTFLRVESQFATPVVNLDTAPAVQAIPVSLHF